MCGREVLMNYPESYGAISVESWDGFADMLVRNPCDGVYYVAEDGLAAYVKVSGMEYLKYSDCVLVGFTGAVNNKGKDSGPFFSFSGISRELKMPLIAFSDPSLLLSSDLKLGWYLGNRYIPNYPNKIAAWLDIVCAGIQRKLILSGGSGGGFASLNIANLMGEKEKVVAFVWNPQVVIKNYYKKFVEKYIKDCWGDKEAVGRAEALYSGVKVVFLIDGLDHMHLRLHLREYLKSKGFVGEKVKRIGSYYVCDDTAVMIGDWGDGHTPPPRDLVLQQLKEVIRKWDRFDIYESPFFKKEVLDFSLEGSAIKFKESVNVAVNLIGDIFQIKTDTNKKYIGFQIMYKVLDGNRNKIMSTSWLQNSQDCLAFGSCKHAGPDLAAWSLVVVVEDFLGNRKGVSYRFGRIIKKYSLMK